ATFPISSFIACSLPWQVGQGLRGACADRSPRSPPPINCPPTRAAVGSKVPPRRGPRSTSSTERVPERAQAVRVVASRSAAWRRSAEVRVEERDDAPLPLVGGVSEA